MGGWVLLFGCSNGHISRKTGVDKKISSFPIKNSSAEERKRADKELKAM